MNQSEYLIVHLIFVLLVYHINKIEKTHKQLDVPKIEDKKGSRLQTPKDPSHISN